VAGALVDVIYHKLFSGLDKAHMLRIFGFLLPIGILLPYVATVLLKSGTWWSAHFVGGYIVIAGIAGTLMTYLLVPPGDHELK